MAWLFLFDIDLTLIRTNGAGAAAMTETMLELLGVPDAFVGMAFAGRTDVSLLREAFTRNGLVAEDLGAFVSRFEAAYLPRLGHHLGQRGGVVLPGVPQLLAGAAAVPDARLGLATGNFRSAAEIKLRHFGLWEHFTGGGFADDAEDRAAIVAAAIRRLAGGHPSAFEVVVFGDSPHDIAAATANGATAIGVATGSAGVDELRDAGAAHVFADLSDTDGVLAAVLGDLRR